MKEINLRNGLLMLLAFLLYSCESLFSKLASLYDTLSIPYIAFFACVIFVLGIYAILWQKILEKVSLNKAFMCKSITIIMILCISHFLFKESITTSNAIGAILILLGLILLVWKR